MNSHIKKTFIGWSLVSSLIMTAGNILNPQANEDYQHRIIAQPEIASQLAMPDSISPMEIEALKFLYAYLPTPDILDYDPDFYLENIRLSLKAMEEMPWGKRVPDREWRHFVLPIRVNNENLDHSRKVFFDELKDRMKGLSMLDAILEVNHWCHEKVSYQPSDARTSSPLATVCNALGRCGEESTFTVAALRSLGIPARQVYTPRWAHTDDNHAWVEAWADGKWYFLGACEPEPVANLAWFNAPASRGMLMNTNVPGRYDGPEEVIYSNPITTVINVTENYAPVCKSGVYITDIHGNPVADASVRFSLYNYAEFYPLAEKKTDLKGFAEFTSGKGDMIVWATDGRYYNLSKLSAGDTIRLALDKDKDFTGSFDFNLTPPQQKVGFPSVSAEARLINDRRKAYEDSVRLAYVGTFLSDLQARKISSELGLDSIATDLLIKSRGNHDVIETFLRETPPEMRRKAVDLLGAMAEKDLHDVTPDVLADNLYSSMGDEDSPLFVQYVLNPRIEREMLHPYKGYIQKALSLEEAERYLASPRNLEEDLIKNLIIDSVFNPDRLRQSPTATMRNKTTDPLGRSIAFVAICRSLGIPARIDPVSHATQFADADCVWHDVSFGAAASHENAEVSKSVLHIVADENNSGRQPKYYSHFTISRIADGKPELQEFDDFESVEEINNRKHPLSQGEYLMVSGQRLADGSVLAHSEIFKTSEDSPASPKLIVRQDSTALQVIGNLDAELLYTPISFNGNSFEIEPKRSILSSTGRGYYVLGFILPGHEPSAHALNDISAASKELSKLENKVLILLPDEDTLNRFRISDYGELPGNVMFGLDDGSIRKALQEGLEIESISASDLPYFVVADTFNRIVFSRSGYSINLGDNLTRILKSLE